jgi:hypothetical protein
MARSGYNESAAVGDIYLNQAVGCSQPGLSNWTCGVACDKVPLASAPSFAVNKSKETLALIARLSPAECIIVLRGSKNVYNYLEDLDFFHQMLPDCTDCKVHSGFLESWWSLKPQVVSHLTSLGCRNSTVTITGHSLGAAMAVLAAYELAGAPSGSDWAVRRAYTYGQPRVGNEAFARGAGARLSSRGVDYRRVVDYRDAVPHLPLRNMLWEGWTHLGNEIYYNATRLGAYRACAAANDTRCSIQWDLLQTLTHTCDHCSYLGLNPCDCGKTAPQCEEPK